MAIILELDDGKIEYSFDPAAVFEKEGKSYTFISLKKISTFTKRDGEKQEKYQNLTVKLSHKEEFIVWLQECLDELKGERKQPGEDDPF